MNEESDNVKMVKEVPEVKETSLGSKMLRTLRFWAKQVKTGSCTDEEIGDALALASPERLGYIREEDYVSADEAIRILGMGKSRTRFFELTRKYGIEANTFKNVKIGFKRNDIIKLRVLLERENSDYLPKNRRRSPLLDEVEIPEAEQQSTKLY